MLLPACLIPQQSFPNTQGDGLMSGSTCHKVPTLPKFHKSTPEGCPQTHLFTVPPSSFCFPSLPKLLPAPTLLAITHRVHYILQSSLSVDRLWTEGEYSVRPQDKQVGSLPRAGGYDGQKASGDSLDGANPRLRHNMLTPGLEAELGK